MKIRQVLLLVIVVFLVAGMTLAQGPKRDIGKDVPLPPVPDKNTAGKDQLPQAPGLSIDVDVVSFDVVVTDNSGNPVSGLEKHHFKIFDDNVEQSVTNFSPTDAPLTVVILIEFANWLVHWYEDVVGSAYGFVTSLRPDDWAALIAFDIRSEILTDFTKNKNELVDGLRRLRIPAYSEISLYDAVYDTLTRLDNVDGKKAIFLLASGLDTNLSKHTYGEALKKAEASDTMIYSVGTAQFMRLYNERNMTNLDQITFLQADNVLRSLSENSGGAAWFPRFQGEYPNIYQMISANLRNQYSLGFVPKVRKTDGKLHKLRVEVPQLDVNKDGKLDKLKVRHKKGYYAPKS